MKTRITELFGIEYPILLSGMSWISVPKMVAAVSNAGGLGILATGPLDAEQTRQAIREIRSLTDKPFGATPRCFPGAAENAKVLLEEKVPVINFALGKGDWIVKAAHEYGGKVIATVVNARHAKRAQDYGADGVIATGHEAAAHGEEMTTFVLIPSLADALKIPVIAAGGFADGRGLAAALALGAEGVAMGTRFMTTKESPLHASFKRALHREGGHGHPLLAPLRRDPLPGDEDRHGRAGDPARARPHGGLLQLPGDRRPAPHPLPEALPRRPGLGLEERPAARLHGQRLQGDPSRHRGGRPGAGESSPWGR